MLCGEGSSYPPAVGIAFPRLLQKGILRLVRLNTRRARVGPLSTQLLLARDFLADSRISAYPPTARPSILRGKPEDDSGTSSKRQLARSIPHRKHLRCCGESHRGLFVDKLNVRWITGTRQHPAHEGPRGTSRTPIAAVSLSCRPLFSGLGPRRRGSETSDTRCQEHGIVLCCHTSFRGLQSANRLGSGPSGILGRKALSPSERWIVASPRQHRGDCAW